MVEVVVRREGDESAVAGRWLQQAHTEVESAEGSRTHCSDKQEEEAASTDTANVAKEPGSACSAGGLLLWLTRTGGAC